MHKLVTILLIIVLLIVGFYVLVFSPWRFFGPFKISGGNPGKYKDGNYVLVKSVKYVGRLNKGEVVLFWQPSFNESGEYVGDMEWIGEIVGHPGDPVTDQTYYYSQKKVEGVVPEGHYLMRLNNGSVLRVLPMNKVTDVVWYP